MAVSIEVKGLTGAKAFIASKGKRAELLVNRGLSRSAILVQGEVKDSIAGNRAEKKSVDTGRFLNSVSIKVSKLTAQVFSLVKYADFLEFGTSKFTGRRHFRNTAHRVKPKIVNIIQAEINKI